MEENKELTTPETEETIQENISLGDALAGVFSEPGETFAAVKRSTKKNYWLVPVIIVIAVSILASILVLRDEELTSSIKEKQKKAMQEQLDKAVKDGSMTREQANQQIEQSQKFMTGSMMMIFGLVFSVVGVIFFFFFKALVYWGGLKIFKGTANYVDIMNVLGLAGIITAIQLVVDTVLAVLMGKIMVNIGPVLLVTEEAVGAQMYTLLAHFDLINIWYLVVVGIGLAKVSSLKNSATIPFVIGLWFVWVLLTSFGPFGMFIGR
jgi:hypothetical protein